MPCSHLDLVEELIGRGLDFFEHQLSTFSF